MEIPVTVTPSSDTMCSTFAVSQIRTSQGSTSPLVTLLTSISSHRAAPPDPEGFSWICVPVSTLFLLAPSSSFPRSLMYSRRYSSNSSVNFTGSSSRMAWSSISSNLLFFKSPSSPSDFFAVFSSSSSAFLFTLSCNRTLAFLIRMSVSNAFSILSRHACEWGCTCNPRRIAEHPGHLSVYPCLSKSVLRRWARCTILGTSLVEISRFSSSVSFLPGPCFTSNSGKSPSAFLSVPPLFHGTMVIHPKLFGSHRCSSGTLLTVLTYLSSFEVSSITISSLLLARTPKNNPFPHRPFNFSMAFPGWCFHMTLSPNSNPSISPLLPFTRSYGVFPSAATSMRFIM